MEINQVEELLSKIGVTSPSDKQAFRNAYNYVFDPTVKLASFEQGGGQPETTTEPEIKAFLAVFRKQFRSPTFPNLEAACGGAKAAALRTSKSPGCSSQMTLDEAVKKVLETETKIESLEKFIKEVDAYRRNKFHKSAREDALETFKVELSEKYSFDSMKFYEVADIQNFLEELQTKILDEFSTEINAKFEEISELPGWCTELREELSQLVTEAIVKNKNNQESVNEKTKVPVAKFKEMMAAFFKENQFATKEAVDSFCAKVKSKYGLLEFLAEPVLKSAWDAKVEAEFRGLETNWKAESNGVIDSFLETAKVDFRKAFKEKFNLELEAAELETIFAQAADIARRNLDKASETKANKANNSKTSLASVGMKDKTGYNIEIPANTKLPTGVIRRRVITVMDNQTSCNVGIYEGDSPQATGYRKLGEITWTDIPSAKKGVEKMNYTVQIDAFGVLHVEWEVIGSGKKETAEFKTSAWQGNDESDEASEEHSSKV